MKGTKEECGEEKEGGSERTEQRSLRGGKKTGGDEVEQKLTVVFHVAN